MVLDRFTQFVASVRRRSSAPRRGRTRFQPRLEGLEGREVPSTTAPSGSPNPAAIGQTITFSATITANPGVSFLDGTLTFKDGNNTFGSVPVEDTGTGGTDVFMASPVTASLQGAGPHTITAIFTSSDPQNTSSQGTFVETVKSPVQIIDDTPDATVSITGVRRHKHSVKETLKVCGKSNATPVQGPLFLVLTGLNPQVQLTNATGQTQNQAPSGIPFVALTASQVTRKHCAKVTLNFTDPLPGKVSFTPLLLSVTGGAP